MTPTNLCPYNLRYVLQQLKPVGLRATVGGLVWERTYRLNDKYICPKGNSGTSGCASYEQLYCPYWGCERWAIWLKGKVHTSDGTAALLQKGKQPSTALLVPVTIHISLFSSSMKQARKLGKSLIF
jgi:hypothetical protein